ncbi:hypothetical protein EOS93_17600 [Rhizobium sp. RMa-01]|uniref:hypothetical protein n=1 Tax=unclassified Rhizobium TaxID=2613769 RepID=UPI0008DA67E1|nr:MULTISPECIES: hypothetical protein [unclassified Rhizobium]OHV19354.1 hypothetical protein BBJ66_15255 [Rhizobium sp. RSm-3]RVU09896.1 hypothetical protein EOS93_17600 [Rhizobium sp. RMa-01]
MPSFILYGIRKNSLAEAKAAVESVFGFFFTERDSFYQAGVYYVFGAGGEEQFVLKKNIDPFDGDPVEQDFVSYPLLFYINSTDRPSELIALMTNVEDFELLRQEVF